MTNSPVKNLPRYLKHFIGTPHLVFVPVHGHSDCGDSSQPFTRANPRSGVKHKSIATYPVDNEMVIFGFESWKEAALFALDNGTEVFESDPAVGLAEKRISDIAYVIWDVRTNASYDRRNGKLVRTIETEFVRKGLAVVSPDEYNEALKRANASYPSTPC
jgi:hypothetical protein